MGNLLRATTTAAKHFRRGLIAVQLTLFGVFLLLPAMAGASSISVGYTTTQDLPTGALVSPDSNTTGAVVPSNAQAANNILGVVVVGSTLAVSQANTQVQVTSEGNVKVLVSDINGSIGKGDHITASPLGGIGMKATDSGKIAGVAQGDLDSRTPGVTYKIVTDNQGVQKQVMIALVPMTMNISYYQPSSSQSTVPSFVRQLSSAITGKEVSAARLWSALIILFITLLMVVVLLYGAVRSSIGAIGRNPLASSTIQVGMTKVIAFSVFIMFVSGGVIYIVLRG